MASSSAGGGGQSGASSPGSICTPLPPETTEPPPRDSNSFYGHSHGGHYKIPSLSEEIKGYHDMIRQGKFWPQTKGFNLQPFYELEEPGDAARVRAQITAVFNSYRKGSKIPKAYPNNQQYERIPEEVRNMLDDTITLDFVQGLDHH
jgi:hypothetical protein